MIDWAHAGATLTAAFLGALVEFVEALTIVLAVGTVRGWRPALSGAAGAMVALAVLVAAGGPLLMAVPLAWLQTVVGLLLLLFGMRWLRKAILRATGTLALHDENAAYAAETRSLQTAGSPHGAWDAVALVASFKAVFLEGLEVVFIVLAIGAGAGRLWPSIGGAAVALLLVVALGLAVHRPLARVPENGLKFVVGVLLSAFGVFWIGEGAGLAWPGAELALPVLMAGFGTAALLAVALCRVADALAAPPPATEEESP